MFVLLEDAMIRQYRKCIHKKSKMRNGTKEKPKGGEECVVSNQNHRTPWPGEILRKQSGRRPELCSLMCSHTRGKTDTAARKQPASGVHPSWTCVGAPLTGPCREAFCPKTRTESRCRQVQKKTPNDESSSSQIRPETSEV